MKNKIATIFTIIFVIIFVLIGYWHFNKPVDSNGVKWNGKQKIKVEKEVNYISIPGFNQLLFKSHTKTQKVNMYNPSENSCTMSMAMYLSDDTELWAADNIQPGNGFYEIELNTELDSGTYDGCILNIRCYDKNGTELNGGKMSFTLSVN